MGLKGIGGSEGEGLLEVRVRREGSEGRVCRDGLKGLRSEGMGGSAGMVRGKVQRREGPKESPKKGGTEGKGPKGREGLGLAEGWAPSFVGPRSSFLECPGDTKGTKGTNEKVPPVSYIF